MSLFQIVGMTPTNKNFLIAYALMKDESRASYMWVLRVLRTLLGNRLNPSVILTDRKLGLMEPMEVVFPNTPHMLCLCHINKDVESMISKLCKNTELGARFLNGTWKPIINARREHAYENAVASMKFTWSHTPQIAVYLETTWLPHRRKFCRAWTNNFMHFENRTTCRVESAHNQLKEWLIVSTGALDTLWARIYADIEAQLGSIRY
ncbi:hypothetical protein M5689_024861 [Euphorbia peplus]|nr:hypothetical protein M5689_024861 [Euphorbia peplus]